MSLNQNRPLNFKLNKAPNSQNLPNVIKLNLAINILETKYMKEKKTIIEDLIKAAHSNAKSQIKTKTSEEISKATGGFGIPGFKWPL